MTKNDAARWATSLWRVAADRYEDRLHRYIMKRLGRQDLEDVAQELYVKLMQVPQDRFILNPEAYIFSVARQVVGEFGRKAKRRRAVVCIDSEQVEWLTENPEEQTQDEVAGAVSSEQFLQMFLEQSPPEQAAALLLFERDGHSYAEIATMLGTSERAVQRYLIKARERLQQLLILDRDKDGWGSEVRKSHHE